MRRAGAKGMVLGRPSCPPPLSVLLGVNPTRFFPNGVANRDNYVALRMGINHKVLKNRNTRSWHGFCVVKGLFIIGRFSVPAIDLGGITTMKIKESGALGMFLVAAISCAAIFSQSANAVIAEPADLSNGDQYRLIFITAGTIDALSADIADHNTFVNAQAALSTDATIQALAWGMLGSTATVAARDNTATNLTPTTDPGLPIYTLDGVRLADSYEFFYTRLFGGADFLSTL